MNSEKNENEESQTGVDLQNFYKDLLAAQKTQEMDSQGLRAVCENLRQSLAGLATELTAKERMQSLALQVEELGSRVALIETQQQSILRNHSDLSQNLAALSAILGQPRLRAGPR